MPTYDFRCQSCNTRFERHQSMTDATLPECPQCGGSVQRLISAGVGFIVKGGGSRSMDVPMGGCCGGPMGGSCPPDMSACGAGGCCGL